MRSPRRSLVFVLLAGALVGSSCAEEADDPLVAASTTSTAGEDTTTTSTGEAETFVPELEWEECGFGECATPEVPLDHDDPAGKKIRLSVVRAPATGKRIGALFVNPGGPGASATTFATTLAFLLPEEINERFDIIGIDPRGVGGSTPIDCGVDPTELYSVDASLEDDVDRAALLEVSAEYVDDCAARFGNLLPHVGTRDVARDMDAIRAGLGDEQLSYLGFSYGTAIGQVYADLFPERIRSMILDGVLELGPTGLELAAEQAAGFETALARFVEFCDAAEGCETAGNALGAVEEVLARSEQPGGIPAPSADRPAGPGEANLGISMALYSESLWGTLDRALAAAVRGDGSGLVELADQYIGIGDFEVYFAVNCMDFAWPSGDASAFFAFADETATRAPHFGEALVNDYVRCVDWPVRPDPLQPVTAPGAEPILVISTTGDPATPYAAGVAVAERLESGVLVTNDGDGHTVVADGKDCIDEIVVAYLVAGEVPADGTTCA